MSSTKKIICVPKLVALRSKFRLTIVGDQEPLYADTANRDCNNVIPQHTVLYPPLSPVFSKILERSLCSDGVADVGWRRCQPDIK